MNKNLLSSSSQLGTSFPTNMRVRYSNLKIISLMIASVLMLHLNWNLQTPDLFQYVRLPVEILDRCFSCESSRCRDRQVETDWNYWNQLHFCAKSGENFTKSSVRELGEPLKRKAFLTIGIPTIQRLYKNTSANYLLKTLNALLNDQIPETDLKEVLIVIFLADTEKAAREKVKQDISTNFGKYIKMNMIHVISAPSSFYPQLKGLPRTYKDSQERMYWRSKQTMDYVFMFQYSHGLAEYYMQLEDDVIAKPDYMAQIRSFIDRRKNDKWVVLHVSAWGFIAKVFRDDDLLECAQFMGTFYNEMPCDWLLPNYEVLKGQRKGLTLGRNIFHHIGKQSSSLGT